MGILKSLKMMEQKGNKLITGTTGDGVSYAWYLNYRLYFVFPALSLSLLLLVPRTTHSQWHSFFKGTFPKCTFLPPGDRTQIPQKDPSVPVRPWASSLRLADLEKPQTHRRQSCHLSCHYFLFIVLYWLAWLTHIQEIVWCVYVCVCVRFVDDHTLKKGKRVYASWHQQPIP